jgi:predicted RNA binding protein YcfA (HicA-like mRNA interferase family)
MKPPRDLSGRDFANILCKHWGYTEVHQSGSHVILQTEIPGHQRISIPAHKALRIGTLNALVRLIADHKGVPREKILKSLL